MAESSWLELLVAGIGGGLLVKIADIAYKEARLRLARRLSANAFIDEQLTPLLKGADELVAKLRALAERDFRELPEDRISGTYLSSVKFQSLLFLFANFWARVEIV